ncbi:glycosyltransferase family 4 protein [Simiduia curdlanivorans]|nr:glycosyltransferase family 4 protein [Simiduia curdlanivorans]MDN3638500.1 glycosyltransferase family 4 protein [Simiduia curdlanivorans]
MQGSTILHVIDTTGPGGAETIFTQLCAESNQRGYHALALIRGEGWVSRELERLGVETLIVNCKGSFNVRFLATLIRIILTRKVKLIQSHLLGSNVYASLAGLLTARPVYSTFHGFVDIGEHERFRALKFFAIRYGSRAVFAVTESLASMLVKSTSINEKQVVVIPNGVDTEYFFSRNMYEIASAGPVKIGCLGNVRTAKNYPIAILMMKHLKEQGLNAELHIAGDDTNALAESCRAQALELGVSDSIVWRGFVANTPAYLNELDIFLLCSSSEGHPLALTQAMSCGLPIVTTACGVENIVAQGETAVIVENQSVTAIVDGVQQLASDVVLRSTLGQTAAKVARDKWSLAFTLNNYFKNYGISNDE